MGRRFIAGAGGAARRASAWTMRAVGLSAFGFAACVLVMGFEVVMRYVFGAPQLWTQDTVVMLVGSCFALGGVAALHEETHIRITVFYDRAGPFLRRCLDIFADAAALLYLGLLGWGAWINARLSFRLRETTGTSWDSPLPMVLKAFLLASVVMMALIALFRVARRARGFRR